MNTNPYTFKTMNTKPYTVILVTNLQLCAVAAFPVLLTPLRLSFKRSSKGLLHVLLIGDTSGEKSVNEYEFHSYPGESGVKVVSCKESASCGGINQELYLSSPGRSYPFSYLVSYS